MSVAICYLLSTAQMLTDFLRHWLDIANKMHTNSINSLSISYIQAMMTMWMTTNARASFTKPSTENCEAQLLATNVPTSPKRKTPWSI